MVRGTALVTRDDDTFLVHENESTYIPQGARHRLENPESTTLELIEVQTGATSARMISFEFEDAYGRADAQFESASPESKE